MKIQILQLIEGAKEAKGLTVIIDVFRAFSLECYMYDRGVNVIIPVGNIEEAFRLKKEDRTRILVGERNGKKCEGFDYGNSPSSIQHVSLEGKTIIHTTSAGTQGIMNATQADEIITGSLVNAKAVAEYIKRRNPEKVSLVCMGNGGIREAKEDTLCAEYIMSLLLNEKMDISSRVSDLKNDGGEHFFDPATQEVFPEEDFWMCIQYNRFPYVLKVVNSGTGTKTVVKETLF